MTTEAKTDYEPLPPNVIVRQGSPEERQYLGIGRTKRDEEIANGNLERPFPLDAGGRAQGWFGHQINAYHARIRANRDAWQAERRRIAKEAARKRQETQARKSEAAHEAKKAARTRP
jgi:hypothetical protein